MSTSVEDVIHRSRELPELPAEAALRPIGYEVTLVVHSMLRQKEIGDRAEWVTAIPATAPLIADEDMATATRRDSSYDLMTTIPEEDQIAESISEVFYPTFDTELTMYRYAGELYQVTTRYRQVYELELNSITTTALSRYAGEPPVREPPVTGRCILEEDEFFSVHPPKESTGLFDRLLSSDDTETPEEILLIREPRNIYKLSDLDSSAYIAMSEADFELAPCTLTVDDDRLKVSIDTETVQTAWGFQIDDLNRLDPDVSTRLDIDNLWVKVESGERLFARFRETTEDTDYKSPFANSTWELLTLE